MISLTKSEQKAILFVAVILFLSVLIQWIQPGIKNSKPFDYTLQDSLFRALSADTLQIKADTIKQTSRKKEIEKKKDAPYPIRININTANEKELVQLPGVGSVTAKRIIEYRKKNGPFRSIKEIVNVKRIGPKTLKKIEPYIYLNSEQVDTEKVKILKENKE
ncbi:MAG TPA: helix-hairpin-helix domain-containing protein [Calditrichaeota bacterium]|nr:helix-hairpin-helix domain-containing protein [Calditrichota bacterium]